VRLAPMHSVRLQGLETEGLHRQVPYSADERLGSRRGCMGNETPWLAGASTILLIGSMRPQNPETMARLRSSVPGSVDVRSREGNRPTGPVCQMQPSQRVTIVYEGLSITYPE
jgi:hypothetical protein